MEARSLRAISKYKHLQEYSLMDWKLVEEFKCGGDTVKSLGMHN